MRISLRIIFSFLLAIVGYNKPISASSPYTVAQPGSGCPATINFGETLLCSLNTPGEINSFNFTANPNDRVLVRMGRRSSGLNPQIMLLGGTPICEAHSYSAAVDITNCLLSSGGSYTLSVNNYASSTTGSYALSLQRLNNPTNATVLAFGQTQLATLSLAGALGTYTFTGAAGDKVITRMASSAANLTPHLRLYKPDGSSLCENATYNDVLDFPSCILPDRGQYTLIVSDYAGVDTGSYGITVQRLNNPGATSTIAFGMPMLATISAPGELDSYTFAASAADTVLMRMGSPTTSLTPQIRVYGPDGVKVCEAATYNPATDTGGCLLPSAGTYLALINDYGGGDTGSYGVSLQRVNNPAQTQALTFGQLQADDLTLPGQLASYTFAATSGDAILLRMGDTNGAIYPQLRIFGADGTLTCSANGYPDATEIANCILPSTGSYTLLTNDYTHARTGSYGLTLQRLNGPGNAFPLLINQFAYGAITAPGQFTTYTFTGNANSPIQVQISSWPSLYGIYPSLRLYGPDAVLVCHASGNPGTVEIERCVLPSTASYTLITTNHNGYGNGDYALSIDCLEGDCGPAIERHSSYLPIARR